jgi:hypothetical protein
MTTPDIPAATSTPARPAARPTPIAPHGVRIAATDSDERPRVGDGSVRTRWRTPTRTTLNYVLDAGLLGLFLCLAFAHAVVEFVFTGEGTETLWGGTLADWRRIHFGIFCGFSLGILLHLMLHWNWICSVTNTHVLRRKPGHDDGGRTLIGVGVLIALLHLLAVALLIARLTLQSA